MTSNCQIGAAILELVSSVWAFWAATGAVFRAANPRTTDSKGNRMREALTTMPSARVTWLCALFLLGYVGVEVALGGWIVTFMIRVRHGARFSSGMTATGFWLGLTVGRVVLGFTMPKIGERLAISVGLHLPPLGLRIFTVYSDLPPCSNGIRAPLLAPPAILCLRYRRCVPRFLPRAFVPCRHCCGHKTASAPSSRQRYRIRGSFWRWWSSSFSFRCWRYCSGERCSGASANYFGTARRYSSPVVRFAENSRERGVKNMTNKKDYESLVAKRMGGQSQGRAKRVLGLMVLV